MKQNPQNAIDKGAFLALILLAAAAAVTAMATGPFGLEGISVGASICACLIAAALLAHTVWALGKKK